jgi:hypothetical protein
MAANVQHHAEGVLAGTVMLEIPAGSKTTQHGTSTVQDDVALIAAAPHMHQLGTYQRPSLIAPSRATWCCAGPYSFDEQLIYMLPDQLEMKGRRHHRRRVHLRRRHRQDRQVRQRLTRRDVFHGPVLVSRHGPPVRAREVARDGAAHIDAGSVSPTSSGADGQRLVERETGAKAEVQRRPQPDRGVFHVCFAAHVHHVRAKRHDIWITA